MKNKKCIISVTIIGVVVVLLITIGLLLVKGIGVSIGRYLETKDGTALLVLDNSPIRMSNRTNSGLFDNLDSGAKILVIHDGIEESYPGKTGVYAVCKLSEGMLSDIPQTVVDGLTELGWLEKATASGHNYTADELEVAISYANWTDASDIYVGAINADKMAISSVQHIPIYKFDTLEELAQFKITFSEVLSMEYGWDEVPSFNDVTVEYDKVYFEENALILVYVGANNCTHRFEAKDIFCDGTSFCIHVEETTSAEDVSDAMAGWFITIEVPDSIILNCTEFDAYLE